MGFRSDVYVECGEKAFELFRKAFKETNFRPHHLEKTDEGVYKFSWGYIKWYHCYEDIKVLDELFELLCTSEFNDEDDYAFKVIWIHENDTTYVKMNASGEVRFSEFYVTVDVSEQFTDKFDMTLLGGEPSDSTE